MYLETPLKSHTNIVNFDFIIRFQVDRYKYGFSQEGICYIPEFWLFYKQVRYFNLPTSK